MVASAVVIVAVVIVAVIVVIVNAVVAQCLAFYSRPKCVKAVI